MKRVHMLLLFTAGILLAGCIGSSGPAPEDRYYRIPLVKPPARTRPMLPGVTAIERLRAAGLYHERAVVYVEAGRPLQLKSYHYHHWLDTPARLLQPLMIDWLRQAGFSPHVVRRDGAPGADRVIFGHIRRFERQLGSGVRVVVELELGMRDRNRRMLLWPRVYRASVSVRGQGLDATAAAFGQAIDRVLRDFVRDVGKHAR